MAATDDILAERVAQIHRGFDATHDDTHKDGSLLSVPMLILNLVAPAITQNWCAKLFSHIDNNKPLRRQLIIAAAMIAAEIDRRDREAGNKDW